MNGDVDEKSDVKGASGAPKSSKAQIQDQRPSETDATQERIVNGDVGNSGLHHALVNGVVPNGGMASTASITHRKLDRMPLEVRQAVEAGFLPLSKLIERVSQQCWARLSDMVEQFAHTPFSPAHLANGLPNGTTTNDQSKANLDRKDRLLGFAHDQRADFIKLLVLLQWSQDAPDVSLVLQLNYWLVSQRLFYREAPFEVASIKRRFASNEAPTPDLSTAAEVLSSSKVSSFPTFGYVEEKPLSTGAMLQVLEDLNTTLCSRLALEPPPSQLRRFSIHDGRITFYVPEEFELDVTIAEENFASQFYFLDFRFEFVPSANIPEGALKHDVSLKSNSILRDEGLLGLYDFLHDLVLSYKLNILYQQALELLQGRWSSHLHIELIRRTLVVQYWTNRPAKKSWIEVGVKSSRRKPGDPSSPEPSLAVKWMKEQEEVIDADLALDVNALSVEAVLSQAIAIHTGTILESVYDVLLANPTYAAGDLLLEQSSSPNDAKLCYLEMQFSTQVHVSVAIEPIAGTTVLRPATPLSIQLDKELLSSRTLVKDLPSKLLVLRCSLAERELIQSAGPSGWQILYSARPPLSEQKKLFGDRVVPCRSVFLRRPNWTSNVMLAAVFSIEGDAWWLVQRKIDRNFVLRWTSQVLESPPIQNVESTSAAYLSELWKFTSGLISIQANREHLGSMPIRHLVPGTARFEAPFRVPHLSFEFDAAKLRELANNEQTGTESPRSRSGASASQLAFIGNTISVHYRNFDSQSQGAILEAEGRLNVPRKVLNYLVAAPLKSLVRINPRRSGFYIQLKAPIGLSVMEDLFIKLLQFDNILSCATTILLEQKLGMTLLTPKTLSFRYWKSPGQELGCSIHLDEEKKVRLELLPHATNPHSRIQLHLEKILREPRAAFSENLRLMLPLLGFTQPLLTHFQKLQSSEDKETIPDGLDKSLLRVNILPRHPTMYGLQYFAPPFSPATMPVGSDGSPRMIARLEILPCQRGSSSFWVLRPAIEEFESYTRPSFPSGTLQETLRKEIFVNVDPEGGWVPLGHGAACHLHKPQRLLQRTHEVINNWFLEYQADEPGPQQPPAGAVKVANGVSNGETVNSTASSKKTPGSMNTKSQASVPTKASQQKKRQEVITLD